MDPRLALPRLLAARLCDPTFAPENPLPLPREKSPPRPP
jgi:hypothetical protein